MYGPAVMPIQFLKGDIFASADLTSFAFPSDAGGTLDRGVGLAFKKKWPSMAAAFSSACENQGMRPGDVFEWRDANNAVYIFVLQPSPERSAKLSSLSIALEKFAKLTAAAKETKIGIARLATKPNGLDAVRVKRIMSDECKDAAADLIVFEQFVRTTATA
jgi:hypothetical protein